ncbi:hypothetical protein U1R88_21520 [Labrys sp. ZIDIC5]|nr:hypothetical protein [Labrys sp. ZIDIC5]
MPGAQGEQGNGNPAEKGSLSVKARSWFGGQTFNWVRGQEISLQLRRNQERSSSFGMVDSPRAVRRQLRMKLAVLRKSRFVVADQADGHQHLTAFLQARLEKDCTMSANTNRPG